MRTPNGLYWECDYCHDCALAPGAFYMPSGWTRFMLDNGGWVDSCPHCRDIERRELEEMGIGVVRTIDADVKNANSKKREFQRRATQFKSYLSYLDNKANEMNAKAYDISGLVDVTVTKMR